LLLIIYDEHGGIYDHVVPPTMSFKDENKKLACTAFRPGQSSNDQDYQHSSVAATVRKLFCPDTSPLTWREAQAATFDHVLTLEGSDVRTDVVELPDAIISPEIVDIDAAAEIRSPTDLSVSMAKAMDYSLQQRGVEPPGDPSSLETAGQVAADLREANKRSLNPTPTYGKMDDPDPRKCCGAGLSRMRRWTRANARI